MTHDEHTERHKLLHRELDELVADFIRHTQQLPSKTTLVEFLHWSHTQTINATEEQKGEEECKNPTA